MPRYNSINGFVFLGGSGAVVIDLGVNGNRIDLDADNDTSIRCSADDTIDVEIGGSDLIQFNTTAADFSSLTGIIIPQTVTDLTTANTPTDAELDSAFGTPATLGKGFIASIDENDADTNGMLVFTTAGAWFHIQGTKAT